MGEAIAFDFDAFYRRRPIRQLPLSVLAAVPDEAAADAFLAACVPALAERQKPDEIVLLVPARPHAVRPARARGVRQRLLPVSDPMSGTAWAGGIAACRNPILITTGPRWTLPAAKVREFADRLDCRGPDGTELFPGSGDMGTDVVAGRRRGGGGPWWSRPLERILCRLLAVPLDDPACPVRAYRRDALREVPLQTRGPLLPVEIMAKLTYMVCAVDEIDVPGTRGRGELLAAMRSSGAARLLLAPDVWRGDGVRVANHLLAPERGPLRTPVAAGGTPIALGSSAKTAGASAWATHDGWRTPFAWG